MFVARGRVFAGRTADVEALFDEAVSLSPNPVNIESGRHLARAYDAWLAAEPVAAVGELDRCVDILRRAESGNSAPPWGERAVLRTALDPADPGPREELRSSDVLVQSINRAALHYCDAVAAAHDERWDDAIREIGAAETLMVHRPLLEPAPSPAGPSSEELVRTAIGPAIGAAQAGDVAGAAEAVLRGVVGRRWADDVRRRLGDGAVGRVIADARFFFDNELVAAAQWPIDGDIAARIDTRTLLAYGEDGATRAHEETSRALAGMLPSAELVGLPGVGHGMPLEDPTAVARLIADTVDRWEHGR